MINKQLINPKSIVVIGGSEDVQKPGGKVLKNLRDGYFQGDLYVVNPKLDEVQGIRSYRTVNDIPQTDLAIMAIAANYCLPAVEILTQKKNTRAFIILSAGFSEENEEGATLEHQIVAAVEKVNGALLGPNCIGFLNQNYQGVFTTPIPKLNVQGVDFISGSGATAVFIMESAIPKGLQFSSVYSVGNSAQIGVEEVLKYLDESYIEEESAQVKLLYIESIDKPDVLLKHASSLIRKGCKIAAIKAGASEDGSRAASSHTGALANSDIAVDALLKKAGIIRCYSREELTAVASVLMHPELNGKNIAIITHAGGPAVMLTDALSLGGLNIPSIKGSKANALLEKLFPGSSVSNPIDFLATGTAEQLGDIIDACENDFENIDAMCVIFGSPGLFPVYEVYDVLHEKMKVCKKPIYPILPSVINVKAEIEHFLAKGRINFPDEVLFAQALCKVYKTPQPQPESISTPKIEKVKIRTIIKNAEAGYLEPNKVQALLDAAGIRRAEEIVVCTVAEAKIQAEKIGYPIAMKVIGPVHKSDVGGVLLNIKTASQIEREFKAMMQIPETTGVLMQPMLHGTELFIGVKKEGAFGHLLLCGLGGIYVEVLKDVQARLAPVSKDEALNMIHNLKSYKIFEGVRGQEAVNKRHFAEAISRVSALCKAAPEIAEMDLNPLLGTAEQVIAVDARIRIEK